MRHPSLLPHLADLAVLVAIGEHGSISAGARAVGVAQPNASRTLARLERRFGLVLVRRGARGSELTEHGVLMADWARDALRAAERLEAGAAGLARGADGPLRIAASQTIAEALLPRWLGALHAAEPGLRVGLTVGNSDDVGRLVSTGEALGFVESPDLPGTISCDVEERVITTDRLVVVTAPGHAWALRTRPVSPGELRATPLVVREPGSGTRIALEDAMAGHRMAAPAMELPSNAAVRLAVASGVGPAVLSEHAVRAAVTAGELRAVMVDGLVVERPLRAVWAAGAGIPAAGAHLVELATRLEAPGAGDEADAYLGWGL
ncbi:MAG: LysR family transcriptional regulator [Thermoleophilia bacterium]|nr:LysR family transcriptional regulator [Thermoleophilia bacterium]